MESNTKSNEFTPTLMNLTLMESPQYCTDLQ